MNNVFDSLVLLMGAPPAAGGAQDTTGSLISTVVMFGLVFVVFYFLIIRPQNKKQKETKKMLENLKKGDKVQTIGGLRGFVWQLKEDSVVLKIDETKMEFVRSAIASVIEQKAAEDDKEIAETKEPKDVKPAKESKNAKPASEEEQK